MQSRREAPRYAALLDAVEADLDAVVREVLEDVVRPGDAASALEPLAREAVVGLVARLRVGPAPLGAPERGRLQATGAAAARRGEPVAQPIDLALSAGWAVWDAATRHPRATPDDLAVLGGALLRAGDASAAAIAEGHGEAERERAGRAGIARRAFVDDLLALSAHDSEAVARVSRQAAALGLPPEQPIRPIVAFLGADLDDAGPEVDLVARALERPTRAPLGPAMPIGVVRHGRLLLLAPARRDLAPELASILATVAGTSGWVAVRGEPATDLPDVAGSVADAEATLAVAERLGTRGRIVDVRSLAVERVLLENETLLRQAIDHELGPILRAPRNGATLVRTLAAYLAGGENGQATARALGVAPRTVAYRLERIEALLGHRLDRRTRPRLSAALLGRELLDEAPPGPRPG